MNNDSRFLARLISKRQNVLIFQSEVRKKLDLLYKAILIISIMKRQAQLKSKFELELKFCYFYGIRP